MIKKEITRATLGRLPLYLEYLRISSDDEMVCASEIARELDLGEVLVRRDLNRICNEGRPKIGYPRKSLIYDLETALGVHESTPAVIVGAGRLGSALCSFEGFRKYGVMIKACFDNNPEKLNRQGISCPVLDMKQFRKYCMENRIHLGIIAVPETQAQKVGEEMVCSGITAIWNFAPCRLRVPEEVTMQQENLALSLAHLRIRAQIRKQSISENKGG